jgi:hypothetical protein
MLCDRCSRDIYKFEVCNYCNRKICYDCRKSSKKVSKTIKLVICKDCWSNMQRRKAYKSATIEQAQIQTQT